MEKVSKKRRVAVLGRNNCNDGFDVLDTNYVEYLLRMIEDRYPNCEFYKTYIDEAIAGTESEGMPDFFRMIDDGESQKFDLLITKDPSYISEYSPEAIFYCNILKSSNVEIYFMDSEISTFDTNAGFMITCLIEISEIKELLINQSMALNKTMLKKQKKGGL
jgi:DNA invertase Pin-like site-specific DNA recombinase